MISNKEKLEFIIRGLNSAAEIGALYKLRECIKERIEFYTEMQDKLTLLSEVDLVNHSFRGEVIRLSEFKEKIMLTNKLVKKVECLERHSFAPEMNKLHFKNGGFFSTPQMLTIEAALNSLELNQLKAI